MNASRSEWETAIPISDQEVRAIKKAIYCCAVTDICDSYKFSMPTSLLELPIATLEKVLSIRKQIEALKVLEMQILGGTEVGNVKVAKRRGRPPKAASTSVAVSTAPVVKAKRRTMSPEGRARIAAAQKARWAKLKKA
jgi:hypothetical protein